MCRTAQGLSPDAQAEICEVLNQRVADMGVTTALAGARLLRQGPTVGAT